MSIPIKPLTEKPPTMTKTHVEELHFVLTTDGADRSLMREILANVESQVRGDSLLIDRDRMQTVFDALYEQTPDCILQACNEINSWLSSSSPTTP